MKHFGYAATLAVGLLVAGASAANAQQRSYCYSYEPGSSARIQCLRQEEANARQYARDLQDIERQLRRDHENIGRGLGAAEYIPYAPRVMDEAWNTPRYVYDGYQRYRDNDRRQERRERRQRRRSRN